MACKAETEVTPVEQRHEYWFKRDDLFQIAGVSGGKVRTCWHLAQGATGLVTASSRMSPQLNIVAQIAKKLGIPCRAFVPTGKYTSEMIAAREAGMEIIQIKAGYNNVIISRARENAKSSGYREIPFGMECREAITLTRSQVCNLPRQARRLVVPVGSGMTLAAILHGLLDYSLPIQVIGIRCGADPTRRLDRWAPPFWRALPLRLVQSELDYHTAAPKTEFQGIQLDPIYEAKCIPFLQPMDCLWVVGIRQTVSPQ
jgi:1-aminocyclopropane-1-carboxylate deaminase/D-cysteine desulfhydrase-like pyridoxal-dependent ACC family enzyme